jgi:hypothetical protein
VGGELLTVADEFVQRGHIRLVGAGLLVQPRRGRHDRPVGLQLGGAPDQDRGRLFVRLGPADRAALVRRAGGLGRRLHLTGEHHQGGVQRHRQLRRPVDRDLVLGDGGERRLYHRVRARAHDGIPLQ